MQSLSARPVRLGLVAVLTVVVGVSLWAWFSDIPATTLVEVENQSGQSVNRILVQWGGEEKTWPGVAAGQTALLVLDAERPGPLEVRFVLEAPPHAPALSISTRLLAAQQRLYVRLEPDGDVVSRIFDESVAGRP